MSDKDQQFLADVADELARARAKFPSSYLVLAALTEEVGELAQAMLYERAGKGNANGKDPKRHVWDEAVQVAAMALRVAVEGDPSFAASPYLEPDAPLANDKST